VIDSLGAKRADSRKVGSRKMLDTTHYFGLSVYKSDNHRDLLSRNFLLENADCQIGFI
jgi:hypothetical protein